MQDRIRVKTLLRTVVFRAADELSITLIEIMKASTIPVTAPDGPSDSVSEPTLSKREVVRERQPRAEEQGRYVVVPLFYATNRRRTSDVRPNRMYGRERSAADEVEYGECK